MNAESAHAAAEKTFFDFQAAMPPPAWKIVNDDVMGGVSKSRFQVLKAGGAVFSGVVSLENNGGFASVRSSPVQGNLSGTDAFLVRVRGDGRRYKFSVRTESNFNAPHYQLGFKGTSQN
jgi:NADH dehydrogenase [ubiquinone] 1 alpha subcomplex assembly factor 1